MSEKSLEQLNEAVKNGDIEVVSQLIKAGAAINRVTRDGNEAEVLDPAPLILAAQQGHLEIVRLLLQSKAEVDGMFPDGSTALYHAVSEGHTEVVRALILKGADVNIEAIDDYEELTLSTPLAVAAQFGYADCVQLLLEAGANINALTVSRESALFRAVECQHRSIVQQLLDAGARAGAAEDMYEILQDTEDSTFWKFTLIAGLNINIVNMFDFIGKTRNLVVRGRLFLIFARLSKVQNHLTVTIRHLLHDVLEEDHSTVKTQKVLHAIQYMLLFLRVLKMAPAPILGRREDPDDLQRLQQFLFMEDSERLSREDWYMNLCILMHVQAKAVPNEVVDFMRKPRSEDAWVKLLCKIYSFSDKVASFIFYGIQDPTHPLSRFVKTRWEWDCEKGPWVDPVTVTSTARCTP